MRIVRKQESHSSYNKNRNSWTTHVIAPSIVRNSWLNGHFVEKQNANFLGTLHSLDRCYQTTCDVFVDANIDGYLGGMFLENLLLRGFFFSFNRSLFNTQSTKIVLGINGYLFVLVIGLYPDILLLAFEEYCWFINSNFLKINC